jgi:hypothetical protein
VTTPGSVISLAGQLTDSKDRETYAALIAYINSLPPGDEFVRLAELLGLVSLVGQRVPDAMADFLGELRAQAKAAADYHGQVDTRLAALPQEITAGVDPVAVAMAMSESFRQQLSATALQDTAALLKLATESLTKLSGELQGALKPAAGEYRGMISNITNEVKKLDSAARLVEQHNAALMVRERSNRWALRMAAVFVAFLVGGLCGIVLEKRQTVDVLRGLGLQVERAERPASVPIVEVPRKKKSGS